MKDDSKMGEKLTCLYVFAMNKEWKKFKGLFYSVWFQERKKWNNGSSSELLLVLGLVYSILGTEQSFFIPSICTVIGGSSAMFG